MIFKKTRRFLLKKILLTFLFSLSISFAATIQEVSDFFDKRDISVQGFENARLAAKLGEEIALSETNSPELAARAHLFSCKAYYFLGDYLLENRSVKKLEYQKGYQNCKKGIGLVELSFGKAKKEQWRDLLADLYFMYTANFGRWFEDEGRLDALRYWSKEVKPLLELLAVEMKKEVVFGHGPLRALGRAWFSIPGGRNKALNYLKEAFEKSLHPTLGVSIYPLNTAFYAEALIAKGEEEEAKKILEATIDVASVPENMEELKMESFKVYQEYRLPEMKEEIALCQEILNGIN